MTCYISSAPCRCRADIRMCERVIVIRYVFKGGTSDEAPPFFVRSSWSDYVPKLCKVFEGYSVQRNDFARNNTALGECLSGFEKKARINTKQDSFS